MKNIMVDPFGPAPVPPLLQHGRMPCIGLLCSCKRFSGSDGFSIHMGSRGTRFTFNIPQVALVPELPGHKVTLAAVHQKLPWIAPVPIVFQPGLQTIFVGCLPQSAHILVGHIIGHRTTEIPEETVRLFHTSYHTA